MPETHESEHQSAPRSHKSEFSRIQSHLNQRPASRGHLTRHGETFDDAQVRRPAPVKCLDWQASPNHEIPKRQTYR
jgi:hypothetical protein